MKLIIKNSDRNLIIMKVERVVFNEVNKTIAYETSHGAGLKTLSIEKDKIIYIKVDEYEIFG